MRKNLALIYGTPIAIALILVAVYFTRVQDQIEPLLTPSDSPTEKAEYQTPKGWGTYIHPTRVFKVDYPAGSTVEAGLGENVTITYRPTGFNVPIVNINIEEAHDDEFENLRNMSELSNVEINGLKGRLRIDTYEADEMGPGSTCKTYRLEHDGMFYSLSTWECIDWDFFEGVVKSFRFPNN